jgi:signal peptide peptidase SppA
MLPHLAARLFGTPLLIHQPKLEVILSVLGPRVGLPDRVDQDGYVRPERPIAESPSGIAVIPIHGSLVRHTVGLEADSGLTSYQGVQQMLDMARDDGAVDAILLDIDSPGGESSGVFDLADKIRTIGLQKPVWAVANDMAFSAAYALASAAQKVFVSRTGGVGSIGVIAMHVDQSVKDAQDGLHYTAVYAGSRKNDLSPHGPMTTEAQRFLQGEVDRVYGLFVDTVARHRGLSSNTVRDTEAGLFFGKEAVRAGLADAVGTLDDALLALTDSLAPTLSVPTRGNTMARTPRSTLDLTANADPSMDPADQVMEEITDAIETETTDEASVVQEKPEPARPQASAPTEQIIAAAASAPTSTPTFTVTDALEIAQTCALAGRTDLTAAFIEAQVSPSKVRARLLADKADRSTEIISRIDPSSAVGGAKVVADAATENLMVRTVKNRLATR